MASHQRIIANANLSGTVRDLITIEEALRIRPARSVMGRDGEDEWEDSGFRLRIRSQEGYLLEPEKAYQWDQDEVGMAVLYGEDDASIYILTQYFPKQLGDLIRANGMAALPLTHIWWDDSHKAGSAGADELALHTDGRICKAQPIPEPKTYAGWSVEDMYHGADSNGSVPVPWSDEQAKDALERMAHKADVSIGITWDTLTYYLMCVLESETSTTNPGSQTTDDYGTVLPQSREIHRHDFRYLVGDAVFYDMIMMEGSDPTEQTFRIFRTADGAWRAYFDLDGRELRCYWTITDPSRLAWLDTHFND